MHHINSGPCAVREPALKVGGPDLETILFHETGRKKRAAGLVRESRKSIHETKAALKTD
jgi:hypothetical protein